MTEESVYKLHQDKPSSLFLSYIVIHEDLKDLVRDFHDLADIVRTTKGIFPIEHKPLREVTPSEAKLFVREYHLIAEWQKILDHLKDDGYKEYWKIIRTSYGALQQDE